MRGETEDIEFLARSETRTRLVKMLYRDGELGRDELRDRLDASRTTVQRNLDALEDRGWVRNGNRTYSLATCGELIAEDFLDLVETASIADRLQPVLRHVDRSELDLDYSSLTEADVLTAEPGDPWSMVNRHVERLKEANDVRALLPVTGLHAMEVGHDRVVNHGATSVHVASPAIVDTFENEPAYREYYEELAETDRYRLLRYSGDIPYFLGIIDDVVQIGVDEAGEPRALLETTDETVREWAERTFARYRDGAEPLLDDDS